MKPKWRYGIGRKKRIRIPGKDKADFFKLYGKIPTGLELEQYLKNRPTK